MPDTRSPASRVSLRAARTRWLVGGVLAGAHRRVAPGCVALTFDDGPHPATTGRVLDTLLELDVPATFFCVGRNARAHPGLVARAVAEGHAVGSHSETHPHPEQLPAAHLRADYAAGRAAVSEAARCDVRLFRPPHGRLPVRSALTLRWGATVPWLWSVDPQDWRGDVTRQHVASVAGAARSGDVVLLHDWVEQPESPQARDRSPTIEALPEIVARIRSRGLRLTRVEA
ncbi:polysaccharide deacetylase family protein [Geodermatophilus sp. SYSU D00758]